jgi:hypothetical protein
MAASLKVLMFLVCGDMWRLAKAMARLPTRVRSQHLLRSEIIPIVYCLAILINCTSFLATQ